MKRLFKAGVALALIAGTAGCVDLGEKLVSNLGASYISTPQGLTDATNSIYSAFHGWGFGDTFYGLEVLGTDTWTAGDQVSSGGPQPWGYLDTYNPQFNSTQGFVSSLWGAAYTIIARTNVVLDNGPNTPVGGVLTQATKDSRLGEAHFFRGWTYFQLVQQFGGVTINEHAATGVSTEATRETEDSTYKFIIADLQQAESLLPANQTEFGRVTKGAAMAELAKVYLAYAYRPYNSANKTTYFQKAQALADSVINSGRYSLSPVFANLWCGTHRSDVPADPGRQGFCDMTTNWSEANPEVILSMQYSYLAPGVQYKATNGAGETNYQQVVFLSQYDNVGGWAAGMRRTRDDGRPFRRVRPLPSTISFFQQTMFNGTPTPGNAEVLDTRFDGSYQTLWFANQNGTNPAGTCPKCTNGQPLKGTMLQSGTIDVGAAAGSDTSMVYLMYQVPDSYRQSKAYRIATPCTTPVTADCGTDNDAKGMFGFAHYPSLKKHQDNLRADVADQKGGKDLIVLRLGEMYLVAAEAAVGLGQNQTAADRINVLRNRAACDPSAAGNAPKLCKQSHKNDPALMVTAGQMNLDFIYDEREREMSGEFTRWDDLHRPGVDFFLARIRKYNPYAAPNVQAKHYFRPIPQSQIGGITGPAPYPQNPGWE